MDELSARENLYQLWMIYTAKNDKKKLEGFIDVFISTHQELIDHDFTHLKEGFSEEGPHLTLLPDGILEVFALQLSHCSDLYAEGVSMETVHFAESLLKCLIVICRNYDNVPLVASCEFVSYAVTIATTAIDQICRDSDAEETVHLTSFVKHVLHFLECLYDPYFIWRKRLSGWKIDKTRLKFRPALLHVEVIPFFYAFMPEDISVLSQEEIEACSPSDSRKLSLTGQVWTNSWPDCFQKPCLLIDVQLRLLHLFGAVMAGGQHNALKAITPATLDVLLHVLSNNQVQGATNENRPDLQVLKNLVIKCIVRMVQVIHCSSPEQRQVEVNLVMEGYMQVILGMEMEPSETMETQLQLTMIGAVNEMLGCQDKNALQVILVSAGTFDSFVSLLQKTPLTGAEAQTLAMSVLQVMSTVLAGCPTAKEKFNEKVGYRKFVDSLKSLGQPSMELLKAVLNLVVEGDFSNESNRSVHNTQAAVMLVYWLPDIQSHDLQIWLSERLMCLCSHGYHNRMNCCNEKMIGAILSVLSRERQINPKAVGHLIGLLEMLGTCSINASEMKQLIGLLKLDEEDKQMPHCTRLMRALSTMARREGKDGALNFFNIQEPMSGIALPGIRKWPGQGFSFHTWICLESHIDLPIHNIQTNEKFRRQLYSFNTSSGCGFEAFFTPDCVLVVAVFNKKEYNTAAVLDHPLKDLYWHCLDIVHVSSRRPFTQSQLSVYIDGRLRLSCHLKFPTMTEPFISCRIGSPGIKSGMDVMFEAQTSVNQSILKNSPLKFLFPKSSSESHPGVSMIPGGTQEDVWGSPIPLQGQLGSCCIFHEGLQPAQAKALYAQGPNHLTIFSEDAELTDLTSKLLLHYNAKACKDKICIDLSSHQYHGMLIGSKCVTWDVKDIINCIGGIQVLFPLLEQLNQSTPPESVLHGLTYQESADACTEDDFVIVPSSSYADSKLEHSPVAGFLTLLRNMLQTKQVNQDTFTRTSGAATVGALLQMVSPALIDVNVLMAVQKLIEAVAATNRSMLNHLYQYILFDFRVWSKSEFAVRIGHIQFLSTIIKEDRKYFRKNYGVQYILDVIRSNYSSSSECGLSRDDSRTIRCSLLNLVKYYIMKDITAAELSQIVGFIVVVKEDDLICEVLDLLIMMLEAKRKQDQLYLLLFEPDMAEMFYPLLMVKTHSLSLREKVCRILHLLLKSEKVYEKNKTRLRLHETGYAGLISNMQGCDLSTTMVKLLLEQVSMLDTPHCYNAVLCVIQLTHSNSMEVKLEAIRQVLGILVSKPFAAKNFAKQLGWQETITKLFVYKPNTVHSTDMDPLTNPAVCIPQTHDFEAKDDSLANEVKDPSVTSDICDPSNIKHTRTKPPNSLGNGALNDMSLLSVDNSGCITPRTPSTPLYITSNMYNEVISPSDTDGDRSRSMSRSSSGSHEDLVSIARCERETSVSSLSNSLSYNESFDDSQDSAMYDNRRQSVVQAENFQKALDNIGIQRIYVNDSLEISEELCQNLLIVLLTIMWKGNEGSDRAAWKERGQVFSSLDEISKSFDLIRPVNELKRRLMEMLFHSCTADLREGGPSMVTSTENAIQLVKIVHNFLMDDSVDKSSKYHERLVEDVMTLLDVLNVWETQSGTGWTEMVHFGFSILLVFAKSPDLELCALATARLHSLIQTRTLTSSAEACFLVGTLNDLIQSAVLDNADSYSFLIPVIKALVEKVHVLLNMVVSLPTLPETTRSPTFFDDFKNYCLAVEWTKFIDTQVRPQMDHFQESCFSETQLIMVEFWAECHEAMMVNGHKRNREKGESQLKFKSQILDPYKSKYSHGQRRFQNVSTQQRNQHQSMMRQWRATKRFFTGERGAWAERNDADIHWKLSNMENFSRIRVKLIQNYGFDQHIEASRLRDNLGIIEVASTVEIQQHLNVSKEALVSKENMADDSLGDEDWSVISSASSPSETYADKEKLVFQEDCELVTLVEVIKGRLEVTTTHVYFFDCTANKEEGGEDFKWALSQLREIHFRRYNLRRSALEMFLIDQTNYFLNFQKKVRNKVYSQILSLRPSNLIYYGTRSPVELLKASGLTQKWVQREISNFEYLMQLNTIAGRTYNDLSQYPVFPWIIQDFQAKSLDLDDPSIYRDLSKPMGIVNPKNEAEVRDKFDTFEDPSGIVDKFHYGTHYSNAAGVMHYMIRMEPFTSLHIELQGDRFDVADRQFHSIPSTMQSVLENPNDVKELIPEFFYLPEFLVNKNKFDLGRLQMSKLEIDDVVLPAWADSPEDFIYKHRRALESEHVSANLHHWIDLIFGYKQKGPAAAEALNVFYYCTYEGAVDLDAIQDANERKALEGMINNFGQTPCQLLKDPHPCRMPFDDSVVRASKADKPVSVFGFLNQLKVYFVEVSSETDPLIYVTVPRNQPRSIIQHGMPDSMITISAEGFLGQHGWLPYAKSISHYFTFEKDPALSNAKTRKRVTSAFMPGLSVESKLFVVSHDARLLFSGGHWDNSLQVFHLGKGKKVNHIGRHTDVVSCLALDYCGNHLITGSRDTTCMIWQVIQQGGFSHNLFNKPIQILYGHDAEVSAVHISTELDMVVSASKDGSVIIHTVRKGHYVKTLRPPCESGYLIHIPLLAVSDIGQIALYTQTVQKERKPEKYSLHLYSINGNLLFSEEVKNVINHMVITGEHLVVGSNQGELTIMELFGLDAITTLQLYIPIQCLSVTPGNSHLLAGLKDGKLIIVGIRNKAEIK